MTRMAWLTPFFARLAQEGIIHHEEHVAGLAPARAIRLPAERLGATRTTGADNRTAAGWPAGAKTRAVTSWYTPPLRRTGVIWSHARR